MKARIFWCIGETEDSMVVEAPTLEEIRDLAAAEIKKRQPDSYWSEILEE